MKINRLKIKNFRVFEILNDGDGLCFDGKNIVLFGKNGVGKSSILKSINNVFDNISNVWGKKKKVNKVVDESDIRNNSDYYEIDLELNIDNKIINLSFDSKNVKIDEDSFKDILSYYKKGITKNGYKIFNMPFFINYGIDRIYDKNVLKNKKNDLYSMNVIEAKVNYEMFVKWFKDLVDHKNKITVENRDLDYQDTGFLFVTDSIKKVLDNCIDVNYIIVNNKIELNFKYKNGNELNFSKLSDGEKTLVLLFGDISRRIVSCNLIHNNKIEGGIVIIDEIEQHLHPIWQRKIINKLSEVFKNIQFIITTHSPIVLSELNDSYKALYLKKIENNRILISEEKNVSGYDINHILAYFMDTEVENERVIELKRKIGLAINMKDTKKLREYIDDLERITDKSNEDVEFANFNYRRLKNVKN